MAPNDTIQAYPLADLVLLRVTGHLDTLDHRGLGELCGRLQAVEGCLPGNTVARQVGAHIEACGVCLAIQCFVHATPNSRDVIDETIERINAFCEDVICLLGHGILELRVVWLDRPQCPDEHSYIALGSQRRTPGTMEVLRSGAPRPGQTHPPSSLRGTPAPSHPLNVMIGSAESALGALYAARTERRRSECLYERAVYASTSGASGSAFR